MNARELQGRPAKNKPGFSRKTRLRALKKPWLLPRSSSTNSLTVDDINLKDPKLRELWYVPHSGSCRIYIISRSTGPPADDYFTTVASPVKPLTKKCLLHFQHSSRNRRTGQY